MLCFFLLAVQYPIYQQLNKRIRGVVRLCAPLVLPARDICVRPRRLGRCLWFLLGPPFVVFHVWRVVARRHLHSQRTRTPQRQIPLGVGRRRRSSASLLFRCIERVLKGADLFFLLPYRFVEFIGSFCGPFIGSTCRNRAHRSLGGGHRDTPRLGLCNGSTCPFLGLCNGSTCRNHAHRSLGGGHRDTPRLRRRLRRGRRLHAGHNIVGASMRVPFGGNGGGPTGERYADGPRRRPDGRMRRGVRHIGPIPIAGGNAVQGDLRGEIGHECVRC